MRILVIEDEPKVARTLVKGLEADHFAVDLAGDGEEGLQLATEIDYDGIILDWNLPKLDGLTVLRKLRKSGSNMRILLLSARKDVSDRVCGLQAGADDYLVNHFHLKSCWPGSTLFYGAPRNCWINSAWKTWSWIVCGTW